MARHEYDIGIIGGGAAGLTVAAGAAQLGAKTILIEKDAALGGDCLHYGCVPSKTLIKSAKVYQLLKETEKYGLPTVETTPVKFSKVAARIKEVVDHIQVHDSVERFAGLGVDVQFGHAEFTDQHTISLEGKAVSAEKWVIATGSSAAIPPIKGLSDVMYLTNRDIFTLQTLPESLIVIGGGAIAMEMAQAFCRLGSHVEVIQRSDQILSKEDKDLADLIMENMKKEGVVFHLGSTIDEVRQVDGFKEVQMRTDAGEKTVRGTEIFVALGRRANTSGFGLENTGIDLSPQGIAVDEKLRTSMKHIYAAGDVIGGYQFTHAAGYEGGIVLSNSVLHFPRKVNYTWMPWCTYTSPELASIGLNEKRASEQGIKYTTWQEDFQNNDRAHAEGDTSGGIKLLLDEKGKPLGAQIVGAIAGEVLAQWITSLNGKVKLSNMAGAIQSYPTYTEINKRVVGSIFSEKLFSPKVRKVLSYLFKYRGD